MDTTTVLRDEIKQGHDILEQAVAGLPADQLHHQGDGWTIRSIASIYAHTLLVEDYLMNNKILEREPLFARGNWAAKTGIEIIPSSGDSETWLASLPGADFGALRQYAEQVYAETDSTIASLSESDLDRIVTFVDEMPIGSFLGTSVAWHAVHHGGEICALKGVLGGKGLPF